MRLAWVGCILRIFVSFAPASPLSLPLIVAAVIAQRILLIA